MAPSLKYCLLTYSYNIEMNKETTKNQNNLREQINYNVKPYFHP